MKSAMRLAAPLVFCLVSSSLALPQEKASKKDKKPEQVQTSTPTPAPARAPLAFGLSEDTPVRMKLTRTMSSSDAEITVDGKYVGSTPSTIRLTVEEHANSILKEGLKAWQRTMTITPNGDITIEASLEKIP